MPCYNALTHMLAFRFMVEASLHLPNSLSLQYIKRSVEPAYLAGLAIESLIGGSQSASKATHQTYMSLVNVQQVASTMSLTRQPHSRTAAPHATKLKLR